MLKFKNKQDRILFFTFLFISVVSQVCFLSSYVSPLDFWPFALISYGIPIVIIINLLMLIIGSRINLILIIFPILNLASGFLFIDKTVSITLAPPLQEPSFELMSYNVKLFREQKVYNKFSSELINQVVEDSTDIKCLQEFSTNAIWEGLDISKKIRDKGYNGFEFQGSLPDSEHSPGMAIFSKFPMLNTGVVWTSPGTMNAVIYADLLIDADTIRIYNTHLASMDLRLYELKSSDRYLDKIKYVIKSLKQGATKRQNQTEKLLTHSGQCPYPFIIAGDFNETPYSYNYYLMNYRHRNAFEESGNGFGFSYNGLLFFLRIDHHFYSDELESSGFRVDRSMKISDHFPTRCNYSNNGTD
ncbi:MAG: endonuclease/exonuclease/phosphatase family protein [Reichenbachiella sp.]